MSGKVDDDIYKNN